MRSNLLNKKISNSLSYCGMHCTACGIHKGDVRKAVENFQQVLQKYGVERITKKFVDVEPSFKHYESFVEVLNGLANLFGDCSGCFSGDGDPNCSIRVCCIQRAPATCVECIELDTCERLRTSVLAQQCIVNTLRVKKKRS
ncbi:MAG: hypothetical protein QG670_1151 [Thermoproteota archaeon]|nr:hypothetical protein [Thermoproteota archaeon]